jgi:hypothetical protein
MMTLLGPPALPASMRLLLANPSNADAVVDVTLLTESGMIQPAALQGVRLGAGRATRLGIAGAPAGGTIGFLITSEGAGIVAAVEAIATAPKFLAAYAATALPDVERGPVAIVPDARAGVPA